MRSYLVLGSVLVLGAPLIGYLRPDGFSLAGYFAGAVLLSFSVLVLTAVKRERQLT